MKHATLAGTFEIGERLRDAQLRAVEYAHKRNGDHILLVNDIGVAQKVLAFEHGGSESVNALYADRLACARSGCQISQLPKNAQEAELFRDDQALCEMLAVVRAYTSSDRIEDIQRVCLQVIVPEQIRKRCILYGLDIKTLSVLSERALRNQASRNLRVRNHHSLESLMPLILEAQQHLQGLALLLEELQSHNRIPTCRAIMLQCYIELAGRGYTHLTLVQESIHALAFENAAELYRQLHVAFPQDPRFHMQIEHVPV